MRLVFDIETDGLLDELTKVHCLVIYDLDNNTRSSFGEIMDGLDWLMDADQIIGHNILKFDIPALQKVYPHFKPKAQVFDTLICSRLMFTNLKEEDADCIKSGGMPGRLCGRNSIEAWGYRLGLLKGEYGKTADWKVWTPEMQEYCERDVDITVKLLAHIEAQRYSPKAIELEHEFAKVTLMQEQRGFAFDEKAATDLYATLVQRRLELTKQLQETFPPDTTEMKTPEYWHAGGQRYANKGAAIKAGHKPSDIIRGPNKVKSVPFNPGSRQQIAKRLIDMFGWKPTKFTPSGEVQIDDSIIEELPWPEAKLLGEYLLVGKRIGQLAEGDEAWLRHVKKGRIHGEVISGGTVTGRCAHTNPNMAQVPRVGSAFGKECRGLFTATPGWLLVGADASGLELRCLAHYLGRYDGGAYAKVICTGDIHTANQHAAGLPDRNSAKVFCYAYLYGAGDEKIGTIIGKGKEAGRLLKQQFTRKTPGLSYLKEAIASAVRTKGYLIGLDGRRLHCRSQHSALNTLLQSAGALFMKQACVILYKNLTDKGLVHAQDYAFVANIHDEWQIECKPELAEDIGKAAVSAITAAGHHFNSRCALAGEYKVGRNWAETH